MAKKENGAYDYFDSQQSFWFRLLIDMLSIVYIKYMFLL